MSKRSLSALVFLTGLGTLESQEWTELGPKGVLEAISSSDVSRVPSFEGLYHQFPAQRASLVGAVAVRYVLKKADLPGPFPSNPTESEMVVWEACSLVTELLLDDGKAIHDRLVRHASLPMEQRHEILNLFAKYRTPATDALDRWLADNLADPLRWEQAGFYWKAKPLLFPLAFAKWLEKSAADPDFVWKIDDRDFFEELDLPTGILDFLNSSRIDGKKLSGVPFKDLLTRCVELFPDEMHQRLLEKQFGNKAGSHVEFMLAQTDHGRRILLKSMLEGRELSNPSSCRYIAMLMFSSNQPVSLEEIRKLPATMRGKVVDLGIQQLIKKDPQTALSMCLQDKELIHNSKLLASAVMGVADANPAEAIAAFKSLPVEALPVVRGQVVQKLFAGGADSLAFDLMNDAILKNGWTGEMDAAAADSFLLEGRSLEPLLRWADTLPTDEMKNRLMTPLNNAAAAANPVDALRLLNEGQLNLMPEMVDQIKEDLPSGWERNFSGKPLTGMLKMGTLKQRQTYP